MESILILQITIGFSERCNEIVYFDNRQQLLFRTLSSTASKTEYIFTENEHVCGRYNFQHSNWNIHTTIWVVINMDFGYYFMFWNCYWCRWSITFINLLLWDETIHEKFRSFHLSILRCSLQLQLKKTTHHIVLNSVNPHPFS